jgi:hypothetical protein
MLQKFAKNSQILVIGLIALPNVYKILKRNMVAVMDVITRRPMDGQMLVQKMHMHSVGPVAFLETQIIHLSLFHLIKAPCGVSKYESCISDKMVLDNNKYKFPIIFILLS